MVNQRKIEDQIIETITLTSEAVNANQIMKHKLS